MFKLMIADDNPYILQDICNITDWEDFDLHLIGAFPNGKLLLQAAKKDMPDVVITDISMPVMNGFALATALQQLSPEIKIIFISSYSDFEYARKALQMQISGYILKPFQPDQLAAVMQQVLKELCNEKFKQFEQNRYLQQAETFRILALENYMCELLYHSKDELLIRSQLQSLNFSFPVDSHFRIANIVLNHNIEDSYSDVMNRIRSILQNYQEEEYQLILLPIDTAQFAILILYTTLGNDIANLLAQFSLDLEIQTDLRTVIGFSMIFDNFSALPEMFAQAQTAATQKYIHGNSVIDYEEIQTEQARHTTKLPGNTGSGYVEKMKSFIQSHYAEPITTNDVATSIFLSSGYANQCFTTECGCTIFDYITQCRMDEAKRLLAETNIKITTIAELAGYSGKTSFYLAFKKNVGISPTEYRKMHELY